MENNLEGDIDELAEYIYLNSYNDEKIQLEIENVFVTSELFCFCTDILLYGLKIKLKNKDTYNFKEFPLEYLDNIDLLWIQQKFKKISIKPNIKIDLIQDNTEINNVSEKITIKVDENNEEDTTILEEEKRQNAFKQIDIFIETIRKILYDLAEQHEDRNDIKDYNVSISSGKKLYSFSFEFIR